MPKLSGIIKRDFIMLAINGVYDKVLAGLWGRLHAAIPSEKEGLRAAIKSLQEYKSSYLGDMSEGLYDKLDTLLEELSK